jgi:hypothetical protein
LLLHANGVVVSHLSPAADIGMTDLSVITAVVFGTIVLRVETKMVQTTKTVATTKEMRHGTPSTPPTNPCPREGEGKGNEGEGGGHRRGRRW